MIVDGTVVERSNKIEVFSPKRLKGRPIKILNIKYKDRAVKLVTSWKDICSDNQNCCCEHVNCSSNTVSKVDMNNYLIPYDTCIMCKCCDTIYVMVNEVFLK